MEVGSGRGWDSEGWEVADLDLGMETGLMAVVGTLAPAEEWGGLTGRKPHVDGGWECRVLYCMYVLL